MVVHRSQCPWNNNNFKFSKFYYTLKWRSTRKTFAFSCNFRIQIRNENEWRWSKKFIKEAIFVICKMPKFTTLWAFFEVMIEMKSEPFHDGGCYHIETSPVIWGANQWAGFYIITDSVMKGLSKKVTLNHHTP